VVTEIRCLSCQDRVCKFVKVERSHVRVSHCLANLARAEQHTDIWLGSGLDDILQELENDHLVILFIFNKVPTLHAKKTTFSICFFSL
jgi:hypothetical protein